MVRIMNTKVLELVAQTPNWTFVGFCGIVRFSRVGYIKIDESARIKGLSLANCNLSRWLLRLDIRKYDS